MSPGRVIIAGCFSMLLLGCFTQRETNHTTWMDRFRSMNGPTGPDAVFVKHVLVERLAGEEAIDRDVWANADEMILPIEERATLEQNGFRVGTINGILPQVVQTYMATHPNENRERRAFANKELVLVLNGPVPKSECDLKIAGDSEVQSRQYEQAQWVLQIKPTLTQDNQIRLRMVPEVQYQDKKHYFLPGGVATGLMKERPTERFETLAFEVTVQPNEFVLIGSSYDRIDTVGYQCFFGENNKQRVQRLLLIRAGRLQSNNSANDISIDPSLNLPKPKSPSLAQQASMSYKR